MKLVGDATAARARMLPLHGLDLGLPEIRLDWQQVDELSRAVPLRSPAGATPGVHRLSASGGQLVALATVRLDPKRPMKIICRL